MAGTFAVSFLVSGFRVTGSAAPEAAGLTGAGTLDAAMEVEGADGVVGAAIFAATAGAIGAVGGAEIGF